MSDEAGTDRDDTIAPRERDALDVDALRRWMAEVAPALLPAGTTLSVHQYPAGYSNLTYRITLEHEHGRRALVLRRPPHGVAPGVAHDMAREFAILSTLHPLGVPVPRPIACCEDVTILGAPFYVMEHASGPILRAAPPDAFTADAATLPTRIRALCGDVVRTLARIHAVPVVGTPLAALGRGNGYVQRQVQGWTKRWEASRAQPVPALDAVAAWLETHRPPDSAVTLVHNDFKLDNLVLDESMSQVRAVLDWEMATVGDPLMDLGTTLAYWMQADDAPVFRALGLGVTGLPGAFTRADVVAAYAEASGRDVRDARFYEMFGVFKVAIIAQQIFARHQRGMTSDPRFARLGVVVEALASRAEALL